MTRGPSHSLKLFQDLQATQLSHQFIENLPTQIGIWVSTQITQNQPNVQLSEL